MIRLAVVLALMAAPAAGQVFEGRTYGLNAGSGAGPLIMALHGGRGSGAVMRANAPLDAAAGGATVVYPDGPGRRWNDGRWRGRDAELAGRDDTGYLLRLAAHLGAGLRDRRVFVIGHSNGGGMALALACAAPDRIAGIAIVATKILMDAPCPGGAPVPVILFHGTEDTLAPHDGRRTRRQVAVMGAILSSDATFAELQRRNRCRGAPTRQTLPALRVSGIVPVVDTGAQCAAPVQRVTLVGGGHGFPGSPGRARRAAAGGPAIPDYDAARAAMVFWGLVPGPR